MTNRKPKNRKGKVQLIDASAMWQKMRKSLGSKRKELSDDHIAEITRLFGRAREVWIDETTGKRVSGKTKKIMNIHKEIYFEAEICEQLAANGWRYAEKDGADYDYQLALFPADVLAWVQDAQANAWETLTKNHGVAAGQTLLNRLRDSLDQSGTLHVLRQGFDVLGVRSKVKMAQFKPALAMNPDIMQRYAANRLWVVRQVHYSVHDRNLSIDLVLFLNGIPVATAERRPTLRKASTTPSTNTDSTESPSPKPRLPSHC